MDRRRDIVIPWGIFFATLGGAIFGVLMALLLINTVLAQDERTVIYPSPDDNSRGRYETYDFQDDTWKRGTYQLDLDQNNQEKEYNHQQDTEDVQKWSDDIRHKYGDIWKLDEDL